MLEAPYADESFPLLRVGKEPLQERMEARAVVHDPEMTQLVADDVVDERQRHGDELHGKSPCRTA